VPLELGRFTLHAVRDCSIALDGGALFGVVPRPLWERQHPADSRNRIQLAVRCLLIVDGARRILVDTGVGERWDGKFQALLGIDRSQHELDPGLARAGFTRGDITDVVLTHLHADACGGTAREGQHGLELGFPNATFHLQRRHWKWAHQPSEKDKALFRSEDFAPLEANSQLHLLEGNTELYPGVHLFVSEGHTVGLQLVRVEDGDKTLVYCGGLVPTASHLRTNWGSALDLYPLTALEEKKQLLAQALEERWVLFFENDPHTAACTLKDDGQGNVAVDEVINL
jgi:glyoxylase-like metal-dependent hydrolase (beta-lactamase superfamily II)